MLKGNAKKEFRVKRHVSMTGISENQLETFDLCAEQHNVAYRRYTTLIVIFCVRASVNQPQESRLYLQVPLVFHDCVEVFGVSIHDQGIFTELLSACLFVFGPDAPKEASEGNVEI